MKRAAFVLVVSMVIVVACCGSFSHGAIRIRVDVDKPVVLAGTDQAIFVKVGLLGTEFPLRRKRLPINVAVVLDKSGSMRSDGKIVNARLGAIEVVRRLNRSSQAGSPSRSCQFSMANASRPFGYGYAVPCGAPPLERGL